jgi:hypothetical protein
LIRLRTDSQTTERLSKKRISIKQTGTQQDLNTVGVMNLRVLNVSNDVPVFDIKSIKLPRPVPYLPANNRVKGLEPLPIRLFLNTVIECLDFELKNMKIP